MQIAVNDEVTLLVANGGRCKKQVAVASVKCLAGDTHHGSVIPDGHCRIQILTVLVKEPENVLVPVPDPKAEVDTLQSAMGGYVLWPEKLIT